MTIDLKPFCCDDSHPELMERFSRGDYTYATNGHVCVRVPRRIDVPEIEGTPDASKLSDLFYYRSNKVRYSPVAIDLPPETEEPCSHCRGSGRLHQCPDCRCQCPLCDEGKVSSDSYVSVDVAGRPFSACYVRLLLALPGLQVAKPIRRNNGFALPFCFDGGDGMLMATSERNSINIKARLDQEAKHPAPLPSDQHAH